MNSGQSIMVSAVAGAVGGVLIMLLLLNSPQAARFFTGSQVSAPVSELPDLVDSEPDVGAQSYEAAVVQAVERANPAVVSIVVTQDVPVIERYYDDAPPIPFDDFLGNDFFSPFNFRVPQYRQNGTEQREVGGGSGFLVSLDGMIVTNKHVVNLEDVSYSVFTNDGTEYEAQVIARDPINDIAILRIQANNLPFIEIANSDELKVGQTVIAIGNALAEFRNTVSVGVVSGLSRSILAGDRAGQAEQLEEVIQTDAAINPGNSGGPLLNLAGEVVGVNVAVALGSQNVGFALPANLLRDVVKSVRETGQIVRPYLGVRYTTNPQGAQIFGSEGQPGVVPDSPAATAGLQDGDIITEIDGVKVNGQTSLASQIRNKQVGQTIQITFLRADSEQRLSATLEAIPNE